MGVSDQTSLMALLGSLEGLAMSLRAMVAAATTRMNMARGGKSMVRVGMEDVTRHAVLCGSFVRTCLMCSKQHNDFAIVAVLTFAYFCLMNYENMCVGM